MGQIKFVSALVMTALFAIAIITFGINFANDNDSLVTINDDVDIVNLKTDVTNNSSQFTTDTESASESFFKSTASPGDQVSSSGGQFKVNARSSISMATSVMVGSFKKIFGQDSGFGIFLTALSSMLIFIGIAYAYKYWFGRNPD